MKFLIFLIYFILFYTSLYSKGVSAATVISSSASLSFSINNRKHTIKSNTTIDIVEQLISVSVVSLDAQDVVVKKGSSNQILSFKVSNIGNGGDSYKLSYIYDKNSMFDMKNIKMYIDNNHNFFFDEDDKEGDSVALLEDESRAVFIVADTPYNINFDDGSISTIVLSAISKIGGSGVRGKIHKKKGIKGVDAIDGLNGGVGKAEGSYLFRLDSEVLLTKTAYFSDKKLVSGSIINYEINLSIAKDSAVWDLKVVDDIPKYTTYERDSLRLNGHFLSDEYDDVDIGYFDCKKNRVVLSFGCLKYPSIQNIKFDVRIK